MPTAGLNPRSQQSTDYRTPPDTARPSGSSVHNIPYHYIPRPNAYTILVRSKASPTLEERSFMLQHSRYHNIKTHTFSFSPLSPSSFQGHLLFHLARWHKMDKIAYAYTLRCTMMWNWQSGKGIQQGTGRSDEVGEGHKVQNGTQRVVVSSPQTSGVPRGGLGCSNPPEIPKIPVESSIAQARRTGVSISFCSSLCSHTVLIY